ncbi:MAG TPA: DNA-formamidopyrimidine glycosylase family protein, partial [Anaerolineaceae bacterium]
MPELPELEVVREVLARRVAGQEIAAAEVIPPGGPVVVRDLTREGFVPLLAGAVIEQVSRRGKFLVFTCRAGEMPSFLVINPKLSGRLQLAVPGEKPRGKAH